MDQPMIPSVHLMSGNTIQPVTDKRLDELATDKGFRANHNEVVSMAAELLELRHRIASLEG